VTVLTMQQGSRAWFESRMGRVTASRVKDVLDFLKNGQESAKRKAYREQIVVELVTGQPDMGGFLSDAMQHGIETEEEARNVYEVNNGLFVERVGLVLHPTIARAAASPDGLIGSDGILEIKCPQTKTHLSYIRGGVLPAEYEPQVMWQLACTGRQWSDFVSYDGRVPEPLQVFQVRIPRNQKRIDEIEDAVRKFLREVDDDIAELQEISGGFLMPDPSAGQPSTSEEMLTDEDFEGLI